VIGKIELTMLVAAAKINQSSIMPAFDQTMVRQWRAVYHIRLNSGTNGNRSAIILGT